MRSFLHGRAAVPRGSRLSSSGATPLLIDGALTGRQTSNVASHPPAAPSPAARLHLWVLLPFLGLIPTALAAFQGGQRDEFRAVARSALRWQLVGVSVLVLHIVLQLGVFAVYWFAEGMGTVPPSLQSVFVPLLWVISLLNVGSGTAEYGFVAFWGLRASRGAPLPFLDGSRR